MLMKADKKLGSPPCQVATNALAVAAATAEVTQTINAVDGFETSLFTGQGFSPSPPQNGAQSSAQMAAPGQPQAAPAAAQPVTSSGTAFQQLLYADLMLQQLKASTAISDVYLLSVHALESGGDAMTKSSLFVGSRVLFSGGAVATFSLFRNDGTFMCSGVSYGYRGFIQEKDISAAIADASRSAHDALPSVAHASTSCPNSLPQP
jgi:hypothetical protein